MGDYKGQKWPEDTQKITGDHAEYLVPGIKLHFQKLPGIHR